ncbi:MAG: NAD(P)-binding domain-containing protein, partial [Mucinivorans sp.]
MKIAIIGYGKMGHEIEKVLLARGHSVVLCIDKENTAQM